MSISIKRKNPRAINQLLARMQAVANKEVAVGFPQGKAQAYPDGTKVAEVAAKNCFGIGVPERNFMALGAIYIESDQVIKDCLKMVVEEVNAPNGSVAAAEALLEAAGLQGSALIKKSILEGDWTPNAPYTIALKGSSKPLIDTAHMKNSVTHVVRDKKA